MPVKVRCASCSKVLNAPDSARGKVIKCPGCEAKVRVPDDELEDAPAPKAKAGAKAGAKKVVKKPKSAEDFLSDLDLGAVEDMSSRVCPKCGTESDMEATECRKCGVEFATGQLSARAARRKGMRGPDPADFYGVVWKDSWEFLKNNTKLALQTGTYWMLFCVVSANMYVFAQLCSGVPPWFFWSSLAVLFGLGPIGWFWYLNGRIIQHTMAREKKLKDVKFDFLLNSALGLKSGAWIFALTFPMVLTPVGFALEYVTDWQIAVYDGTKAAEAEAKEKKIKKTDPAAIDAEIDKRVKTIDTEPMKFSWLTVTAISALVGMFVFPVAQVHLTMKHSWTAWAFWPMLLASFKNIPAIMMYWVMVLVAFLPLVAGAGAAVYFWQTSEDPFALTIKLPGLEWVLEQCGEKIDEMGFIAYCLAEIYFLIVTFASFAVLTFIAAFPAVFVMRANGLFGYYNRERLDLMTIARPKELAGFWPRMVAGMADFVILATIFFLFFVFKLAVEMLAIRLDMMIYITLAGVEIPLHLILVVFGYCIVTLMYFIKSESGNEPATPGMRGVGLGIIKEDGTKCTTNTAFGRFFGRLVGLFFGWIPFLMAGFTPKKQTLHDMMTKTLVVWVGDDEASER